MKKMINKIKEKKGFTLIELIVVIAVIGILVLLAAPKFLGYTKDAKLAQIKNDVKSYEDAITAKLIESEAEGVDQLKEWNWDVADIDTLQEYVDEGFLVDKEGISEELIGNEFYEVNREDVPVKSNLRESLFYSDDGRIYYHNDGLKNESDNESEEIPDDFTLLTDDDFDFYEDSTAPNEYKINSRNAKGFFYYTGHAEKVVIPKKIMGNELRDYYLMFMGTSVTAVINDNSKVTNMNKMFSASFAPSLDLSRLDTSNVESMDGMFSSSQAASLDLSGWNTEKVEDMSNMFAESQVRNLNLKSLDTSNVIDMSAMFAQHESPSLDLSNLDTSNVKNMDSMFYGSQITTLDLRYWDTSKVTNMRYMFSDSDTKELDLSSWDTSSLKTLTSMFENSKTTTGYARTEDDADRFNNSLTGRPSELEFKVK